jgi:hypothetical protein
MMPRSDDLQIGATSVTTATPSPRRPVGFTATAVACALALGACGTAGADEGSPGEPEITGYLTTPSSADVPEGMFACEPARPGLLRHAGTGFIDGVGTARGVIRDGDPQLGEWTLSTMFFIDGGGTLQHTVVVKDGEPLETSTSLDGRTGPAPTDVEVEGREIVFKFDARDPVDLATASSFRFSASLTHDGATSECEEPSD